MPAHAALARLILLALTTLITTAGTAWACSCSRPSIERRVVPADGAEAVPIDAIIRVFVTGGLPQGIRAGLHAEYRVVGPDGPIALTPTVLRTRVDLRPAKRLAPNTEYRIDQLFAYATEGARVDDAARLRMAASARWVATRRWYPVSRFRTGAETAPTVPVPTVAKAEARFAMGGGDCGPGTALWVEYTPIDDPLAVVELMVEGHGVVSTTPMPSPRGAQPVYARVSDMLCTPDKYSLGVKGPFKASVAFVSAAGARAVGAGQIVGGGGLLRRPRPGRAMPDSPAWAALWFKGVIKDSPAPIALGPPNCAAGVELTASAMAAATGGRSAYDDRNSILWANGKAEVLTTTPAGLGRVAPGRPFRLLHAPADSVRSAPSGAGTVAVAGHHTDAAAILTALGFDAKGQVIWRTPLATDQLNWKPRVARCGDTVAASWARVVDKQYLGARVHWALLDPKTGAITARSAPTAGIAIEGEGVALGCAGDGRVWLVGRDMSTRALRAVRLGAEPRDVPLEGLRSTTSAIAPHATGLVVLTDRDGIQASVLNAEGQPQGAPIDIAPAGRKPEVVLVDGVYVAAWERYPGAHVEATAFDLKGRVAEPRRVGEGWSTVGLRVAGSRVALAATEAGAVRLAELRCAERPAEGAPAQLPPTP